MKKIISIICLIILICSGLGVVDASSIEKLMIEDFDILVDINVTVDIYAIRSLNEIDDFPEPNFFVKVFINEEEFTSQIWNYSSYLYNCWSITSDVPDNEEIVDIKIQLWDSSDDNILCDIGTENNDVKLFYSIKTGKWTGDDQLGDTTGYGRLCGYDYLNINNNERDCELWFNIYQNDADGDGIPYWMEKNIYETDPEVDNTGDDLDKDEIPIEWEYKWGYDPLKKENHQHLDDDNDSISNVEEYLTSDFHSDPFRQDIFLEIDWMEEGPNGQQSLLPEKSKEFLKNPFHRRNIVFHLDTGEINGGELIPFDEKTEQNEVLEIYNKYYIKDDTNKWRRGVFHYGIIVNLSNMKGFAFSGDTSPYWGYMPGTNSFVISSSHMEEKKTKKILLNQTLEYLYGSAIMHEMGHNFGIRFGEPFGCDNWFGKYPWQIFFWLILNYKSIMNYQYTYRIFDYSDGTHGWGDYDDWSNIDLAYFETR